jgi:hypothetical protein
MPPGRSVAAAVPSPAGARIAFAARLGSEDAVGSARNPSAPPTPSRVPVLDGKLGYALYWGRHPGGGGGRMTADVAGARPGGCALPLMESKARAAIGSRIERP